MKNNPITEDFSKKSKDLSTEEIRTMMGTNSSEACGTAAVRWLMEQSYHSSSSPQN